MVPEKIQTLALRNGYRLYTTTESRELAWKIRDRLNTENRRHNASIGLQEDDSWAVWYIPQAR